MPSSRAGWRLAAMSSTNTVRSGASPDASKTRLLNVLKRHLSAQLTTEAEASALFTTKLLEDIVEVAAVQDDIGVVGAEGGLADLQGSLVVGAGAGQIAPGR